MILLYGGPDDDDIAELLPGRVGGARLKRSRSKFRAFIDDAEKQNVHFFFFFLQK